MFNSLKPKKWHTSEVTSEIANALGYNNLSGEAAEQILFDQIILADGDIERKKYLEAIFQDLLNWIETKDCIFDYCDNCDHLWVTDKN